jgi:hypothetical protein
MSTGLNLETQYTNEYTNISNNFTDIKNGIKALMKKIDNIGNSNFNINSNITKHEGKSLIQKENINRNNINYINNCTILYENFLKYKEKIENLNTLINNFEEQILKNQDKLGLKNYNNLYEKIENLIIITSNYWETTSNIFSKLLFNKLLEIYIKKFQNNYSIINKIPELKNINNKKYDEKYKELSNYSNIINNINKYLDDLEKFTGEHIKYILNSKSIDAIYFIINKMKNQVQKFKIKLNDTLTSIKSVLGDKFQSDYTDIKTKLNQLLQNLLNSTEQISRYYNNSNIETNISELKEYLNKETINQKNKNGIESLMSVINSTKMTQNIIKTRLSNIKDKINTTLFVLGDKNKSPYLKIGTKVKFLKYQNYNNFKNTNLKGAMGGSNENENQIWTIINIKVKNGKVYYDLINKNGYTENDVLFSKVESVSQSLIVKKLNTSNTSNILNISKKLNLSNKLPLNLNKNCPSKNFEPSNNFKKNPYKKQVLIFHPDKNPKCTEESTKKFLKLKELYKNSDSVLSSEPLSIKSSNQLSEQQQQTLLAKNNIQQSAITVSNKSQQQQEQEQQQYQQQQQEAQLNQSSTPKFGDIILEIGMVVRINKNDNIYGKIVSIDNNDKIKIENNTSKEILEYNAKDIKGIKAFYKKTGAKNPKGISGYITGTNGPDYLFERNGTETSNKIQNKNIKINIQN